MSSEPRLHPGRRPAARLRSSGYHLLAGVVSLLCLLPLLWMLAASLRQTGIPLPRTLDIFPWPPAWENYARIFEIVPLGRYLLNSIFVVALAVPLTLLTASWAGFGMSQLPRQPAHPPAGAVHPAADGAGHRAVADPLPALLLDRADQLALCADRPRADGRQPAVRAALLLELPPRAARAVRIGPPGRRHPTDDLAPDRPAPGAPGAAGGGAAGFPASSGTTLSTRCSTSSPPGCTRCRSA